MSSTTFRLSSLLPLFVLSLGAGLVGQDYAPVANFAAVLCAWLMALRTGPVVADALDAALLSLAAGVGLHALFVGDTPALASVQATGWIVAALSAHAFRRAQPAERVIALTFLGLCGALLAPFAFLQWWRGQEPRTLFLDINTQAAFALSAALAALAAFQETKHRRALAAVLGVAFVLAATSWLLARSKGSTLAAALVFAATAPYWWRSGTYRVRALLAIIVAVALAAAVALALSKAGSTALWQTQSVQSRLGMWDKTVEMVSQRPLLGHGLGSWQHLYHRDWSPRDADSYGAWAHNDYLQLAAEAGVPMLLLVAAVALAAVRARVRTGASSVLLWAAAGVLVLHATVNFIVYNILPAALLGMFLGLATGAQANRRFSAPAALALVAVVPCILLAGWIGWGQTVQQALLNPKSWQAALLRDRLQPARMTYVAGEGSRWLANPYAADAMADVHLLLAAAAKRAGQDQQAAQLATRAAQLYRAPRLMAPLNPQLLQTEAMGLLNLQALQLWPREQAIEVAQAAVAKLKPMLAGRPMAAEIEARLAFIDGHCAEAVILLRQEAENTAHWAWRYRLLAAAKTFSTRCAQPLAD